MTDREKTFFRVLRLVDTDKFYISFQVGLMSLLGINKKGRERQIYFNKISRKSVDFVLISKESLNPVLAIELDDSSHLEISRQKRDEFVEKAMDVAGIPLLRVKNQSWYNVQELRSQIDKIIS